MFFIFWILFWFYFLDFILAQPFLKVDLFFGFYILAQPFQKVDLFWLNLSDLFLHRSGAKVSQPFLVLGVKSSTHIHWQLC